MYNESIDVNSGQSCGYLVGLHNTFLPERKSDNHQMDNDKYMSKINHLKNTNINAYFLAQTYRHEHVPNFCKLPRLGT